MIRESETAVGKKLLLLLYFRLCHKLEMFSHLNALSLAFSLEE